MNSFYIRVGAVLWVGAGIAFGAAAETTPAVGGTGKRTTYAVFAAHLAGAEVAMGPQALDRDPKSSWHAPRWTPYPGWKPIDWDAALSDAPDLSGPRDRAELKKHAQAGEGGDYDVPYRRPLPTEFPKDHFFLIGPSGVVRVTPKELEAVQRYNPDQEDPTKVRKDVRFGQVILSGTSKVENGFVLHTPKATEFKVTPQPAYKPEILRYHIHFPGIDRSFVFIRLPEDKKCETGGCCALRYRLMPEGTAMQELDIVAFNAQCDV